MNNEKATKLIIIPREEMTYLKLAITEDGCLFSA